jgi:anti-sigma regulatory factor (Ser/Thr protein kinase)
MLQSATPKTGFRHEALMYAGEDAFLDATVPFILDAVGAGEPILVVVAARKIERLRAVLGDAADDVEFADMARVGENPARIIPAWQEFVTAHAGRAVRGIGEPIGPERSATELVECHLHESLLNLAFAGAPAFTLVCPYDTEGLDPAVVEHARHTHPHVHERGMICESELYQGPEGARASLGAALPEPGERVAELQFDRRTLRDVRAFVSAVAGRAGMSRTRMSDLVLAVTEIATNSVRHGGGAGVVRVWQDTGALTCEVADAGRIRDPLAGRRRPALDQIGGYGLWLANQLCELVQLRTSASGTVVRLRMGLA